MATIKDVADLAGVSAATVSRVLNEYPQIREPTRNRVLRAVEQLGYQPSRVARRMRSKRTSILGLILSDLGNPFFAAVVSGIEAVAYASGYSLLLCSSDEDPVREEAYIHVLMAEMIGGLIISTTDENSTTCQALIDRGIPVVAMDRRLRRLNVDTVVVDNVRGSYQAVRHLIGLGHRRIALIGGPPAVTTGRERQEGYLQALADSGLPIDDGLIKVGDFKQESGYRQTQSLLQMASPPTAIFVANNMMTLGALNAIHETALDVPGDMAIVGFDDVPWAQSLSPPLTTVAQPTDELGKAAASMLLARIADSSGPVGEVKLDTRLVIRESCGSRRRH